MAIKKNTANTGIEQTAGFSLTSLWYTKYFYCLYSSFFENRQQVADELQSVNLQQVVGKSKFSNRPQLVDDSEMQDKHIDLLFYIIPLHRYCFIEVKITEFDFPDIGQLAGYTAMVDDLLNTPQDNPSIGLLICKEKNSALARYALSRVSAPIGISKYELSQQPMPEELQGKLPTESEIENGLNMITKKKWEKRIKNLSL